MTQSSSIRALDHDPSMSSSTPCSTSGWERGAATRQLDLWWRYRNNDLSVDQSFYLSLPSATERLMVRDHEGDLQPVSEDQAAQNHVGVEAESGFVAEGQRDFVVEGSTSLQLGQLAQILAEWLTLSMRRFYVQARSGGFIELSAQDATRRDVLVRRLDAFLADGAGPYRILAVALRPESEEPS